MRDTLLDMAKELAPIPNPTDQPTASIESAGAWLGLGRTAAYAAAARGDIPTISIGRRKVVPVAPLRRMLGIDAGGADAA